MPARKPQTRCRRRTGLTLIEMLVATAVTLLLVGALTQAFQIVGTAVGKNRALLEMAGQLRGVGIRLETDLSMVTVPMTPWPQPGVGKGYFEYVEGWDHDGSPYLIGNTSFGDIDDLLMFTAQSEGEPFVGVRRLFNATGISALESTQAEIAWWSTLTDSNLNGSIDPDLGEDFTIYRRVLLIRPDLWTDLNGNGTEDTGESRLVARLPRPTVVTPNPTYDITDQTDLNRLKNDLLQFYAENDISVRIVRSLSGVDLTLRLVPNSLEDLTRREYRFAHSRIVAENPVSPGNLRYYPRVFPDHIDRDATSATSLPLVRQPDLINAPFVEPGLIKAGLYQGEDVILPHATAFDLRAFDPFAVVAANSGQDIGWGVAGFDDNSSGTTDETAEAGWSGSDDQAVGPGDPGYLVAPAPGLAALSPGRAVVPIGRGAFVDLFYTTKLHQDSSGLYSYILIDGLPASTPLPSPPHSPPPPPPPFSSVNDPSAYASTYYSHFSGAPRTFVNGGSSWLGIYDTLALTATSLAVYDTWSFDYEVDGVDQDGDSDTDEGSDGLDTDTSNGVDDVLERETSPPYPYPLRGLQARIRLIEHDTRQIRQVTVESDFTPE